MPDLGVLPLVDSYLVALAVEMNEIIDEAWHWTLGKSRNSNDEKIELDCLIKRDRTDLFIIDTRDTFQRAMHARARANVDDEKLGTAEKVTRAGERRLLFMFLSKFDGAGRLCLHRLLKAYLDCSMITVDTRLLTSPFGSRSTVCRDVSAMTTSSHSPLTTLLSECNNNKHVHRVRASSAR